MSVPLDFLPRVCALTPSPLSKWLWIKSKDLGRSVSTAHFWCRVSGEDSAMGWVLVELNDDTKCSRYTIAAEIAVTFNSPMCVRREQLERHMNLNRFTIEDVHGACFFHALLLELQYLRCADIRVHTAHSLRQESCDFLQHNTRMCCPVDCPYLDLVVDPEN